MPPENASHRPVRPPRLLIADDDPVAVSMLALQLEQGFELVPVAADADEAIAIAAEHQPDVAIIDVQMPAGGGLRATRVLQKCSPRTAIVVLSADESESSVREIISAGAIAYVRKDTHAKDLAHTLHLAIAAYDGGPAQPSAPARD